MIRTMLRIAAVTALFSATTAFAAGPTHLGVTMPSYARKIETGRFRSPRDFGDTIRFFKKSLRGKHIKFHREVTMVGAKYVYIENTRPGARWSGINVYQTGKKSVRIYVLGPRAPRTAK